MKDWFVGLSTTFTPAAVIVTALFDFVFRDPKKLRDEIKEKNPNLGRGRPPDSRNAASASQADDVTTLRASPYACVAAEYRLCDVCRIGRGVRARCRVGAINQSASGPNQLAPQPRPD
jgi:hypothetical protein